MVYAMAFAIYYMVCYFDVLTHDSSFIKTFDLQLLWAMNVLGREL